MYMYNIYNLIQVIHFGIYIQHMKAKSKYAYMVPFAHATHVVDPHSPKCQYKS